MGCLTIYPLHVLCNAYARQLRATERQMRKQWRRTAPLAITLAETAAGATSRKAAALDTWWRLRLAHDEVCANYQDAFCVLNVLVGGDLETPPQVAAYASRNRRTDGIWSVV